MKVHSVEAIFRALNDAEVPFIVVGGLAVRAHGYGRYTDDVDIVVRLDLDSVRGAFRAFEALGYHPRVPVTADGFADAEQRAQWRTEKGMRVLNFHSDRHRETPIDVFVETPFDFAKEYGRALVQEIAPGVPVRIAALTALAKLKRDAGRPQDIADLSELRLIHGDAVDD